MTLQENDVQTLRELGLTIPQGKVYLALIKLGGESNANTIFKLSKVARQDVYRILDELQQLSIIEKIIAAPTRFKALPIQEVVSILLERKMSSLSALRAKARKFTENAIEKYAKTTKKQEKDQFTVISEREAVMFNVKKTIDTSQENIKAITPFREFTPWLVNLSESFNKAIVRGVKIRWITEKPENANSWPKIVQTFLENPHFKLRTMPNPPKAKVAIYDNKEIILGLIVEYDTAKSPALWSNNLSLMSIAEDYFEMIWKTAVEYKPEYLPNSKRTANSSK